MPFKIIDNTHTIDIMGMTWGDINLIMMGLYSSKRILENRIATIPADTDAQLELTRVNGIINEIASQYPIWSGTAISVLNTTLASTLTGAGIFDNETTII